MKLEGRLVKLYVGAAWEVEGEVELEHPDKLIIRSGEEMFVVYKHSIAMANIIEKKENLEKAETVMPLGYPSGEIKERMPMGEAEPEEHVDRLVLNLASKVKDEDLEDSYYGSIIPSDMLLDEDEQENDIDVAFGMVLDHPAAGKNGEKKTYGKQEEDRTL